MPGRASAPTVSGHELPPLSIAIPPAPRLVWNTSASAPLGLYWVRPEVPVAKGDMVIARTPAAVRHLAAARRYVPANVPLVKRVAGVVGDRVCAAGTLLSVNGRQVAVRRAADGQGRAMPWWQGCRTLIEGEYFLLMADVPDSFDGRYFGITGNADLVGQAHLLWSR